MFKSFTPLLGILELFYFKEIEMKKLLLVLMLFASIISAQFTSNAEVRRLNLGQSGIEVYFAGELDSVGGTYATLTSRVFDLTDYDGVDSLEISYLFGSTLGTSKVTVVLLGSDYSTTTGVSLDTLVNASTSEVENHATVYWNGKKAKYYWLKFNAIATGRPDMTFKAYIKSPKRDY